MQNKYGGFWNRALALSLDQIILGLVTLFFLMQALPFFIDYQAIKSSSNQEFTMLIELLDNIIFIEIIAVIIWSALCGYFYKSQWQATPGKKLLGMKVVRSNGEKLSFIDGFLRTASLPFFLLLLQILERNEIYSKLEQIKLAPTKYKTVEDVFVLFSQSEVIAYSDLIVMIVGSSWLFLAAFSREKTAFHDILFDTRVIYDKK